MIDSEFSKEKLKSIFEEILPENISIEDFRSDPNHVLNLICPRGVSGEKNRQF